jgi:hypothetical protein
MVPGAPTVPGTSAVGASAVLPAVFGKLAEVTARRRRWRPEAVQQPDEQRSLQRETEHA